MTGPSTRRAVRRLLVGGLAVVALGLTACGSSSSRFATPTPTVSQATPTDPTSETACDEVRAGIAAFNRGDFEGTVRHFKKAVPLARREDHELGTQASSDLLDAVRYYARLTPEMYPNAAESSPEFARYKAITLGQCEQPDDGGGSGSGGGGVSI